MKVAVFSTQTYDREFLQRANEKHGHELHFLEPRLTHETMPLATGFPAICVFVNDRADEKTLEYLHTHDTRLIALRSAGFNNVDLLAADRLGMTAVRVPAYSPDAVAEHTVAMMLALNRRIYRANNRVREGNFSLNGLMGFVMRGRTVGIIGTGQIGASAARILAGIGCRLVAYDPYPSPELTEFGVEYVGLTRLFEESDIITLHCPLMKETYHLIDDSAVRQMKHGVMLINTSRGALLDTRAVIEGLKTGKIGFLGLDVYEEEENLFFQDLSDRVIQDDVFARLLTFPNVLITGHQAFFTEEAMTTIAETTLGNITAFERGEELLNRVTSERVLAG